MVSRPSQVRSEVAFEAHPLSTPPREPPQLRSTHRFRGRSHRFREFHTLSRTRKTPRELPSKHPPSRGSSIPVESVSKHRPSGPKPETGLGFRSSAARRKPAECELRRTGALAPLGLEIRAKHLPFPEVLTSPIMRPGGPTIRLLTEGGSHGAWTVSRRSPTGYPTAERLHRTSPTQESRMYGLDSRDANRLASWFSRPSLGFSRSVTGTR